MQGSYRGPRPERRKSGGLTKIGPPDIHERIDAKRSEVNHMALLAERYPGDAAYKYALARVRDELHQLEAIRDGKSWRRH